MSQITPADLSDGAVIALMNALNPSPNDFACEADRMAFSEFSQEVAIRDMVRRAAES